ncbi:MAG: nucleotidyl transferase AbiEii/AbiGii toxin family protein [Synergistaceae bacterium]|nr:nucleotidyl transferase AbiEii/AbiGii toxin family protein [Synergistaceae bacterium]
MKGGTALLLTRGLDRFSEDMDFDLSPGSVADLEASIRKAAKKVGIDIDRINIKKDTATTKRYMVHYDVASTEDVTPLKIECSMRHPIDHRSVEMIDGIRTYSISRMMDLKTDAFTHRTRGRDIYDLAFLMERYPSEMREATLDRIEEHVRDRGIDFLSDQFDQERQRDKLLSAFDGTDVVLRLQGCVEHSKKHQKEISSRPTVTTAAPDQAAIDEIEAAARLLGAQRATDNSTFRGHELTAQQNDTLDLLEQIKRNVQADKDAMAKLKSAGLDPKKDITDNKIVRRPGQFPRVEGADVVSRTKDSLTLVRGRTLFIYELKRLELKAPAQGVPGEKLDLKWLPGEEKATASQSQERERKREHGRSRTGGDMS